MSAVNKHILRYGNARKILLIGDIGRAFLDVNTATDTRSEICAGMSEAIDIAARKNFAAIAIVMSGISAKLSSDLKALRDNCDAKIVLLAQMYEEPIAIHLVDSAYNGSSLADDYLICPVGADNFYESITTAGKRSKAETAPWRGRPGLESRPPPARGNEPSQEAHPPTTATRKTTQQKTHSKVHSKLKNQEGHFKSGD